ncbi:PIN domain-containing protein [Isoptericola sp. b408]|uniref:PIN domain-containing protein n=1 Tax=Isoptericola sp. b408 TaxID=3064653 RepID=UPI0027138AFC|nr:PIN domain-containing protein [Isoptericola sp. b408]MDO8150109.1 PIN domain-containing protein [Isoptericola sp. b408]
MVVRILVDANVLYSRSLRDWLFLLEAGSNHNIFVTCYTEDIRVETLNNLRKDHPDMDGKALTVVSDRIAKSMWERIEDYPAIPDAPIADPYDRHVHAAAVAGGVDKLLTCDGGFLKLPEPVTDGLPYEICTPEELFLLVDDGHPDVVRDVARHQWEYHRKKDPSADLPSYLARAGCPQFAKRVRLHIERFTAVAPRIMP